MSNDTGLVAVQALARVPLVKELLMKSFLGKYLLPKPGDTKGLGVVMTVRILLMLVDVLE